MGLRNARLDTKYYAIRVLKIDPKTKKYTYSWLPAKYLSNWDAMGWFQSVKGVNSRDMFEWDPLLNQWVAVPGMGNSL